ncbi:hypothetical protein Rsub_01267 [Raphidocelis subcapitata]|uniref:Exostosin GT47 domain-containing protein n=1 Tax=Raphidocelis subcapitata TaxID=307507 RepID=A0A2V0NPR5_9CHLO|nr:hypothetical protein Rsub_01267 [Raphidocelis subcapitata]|eukprot:GBF88552.1 hypothetical protein Rsub_01267 [Raphidocelis subcapitata]
MASRLFLLPLLVCALSAAPLHAGGTPSVAAGPSGACRDAAAAAAAAGPRGTACAWCSVLALASPHQLRLYLAPLPREWAINPQGSAHYQGISQARPFGLPLPRALDPAGGAAPRTYPTASSQLFDTHMFSAGQWFLREARASPLRVESLAEADVVLVPLDTLSLMTWERGAPEAVGRWYGEAPALLPALGRKPHIVVLSKGEYDFDDRSARADGTSHTYGLVGHPSAANFTFLSHGLSPRTRAGVKGCVAGNVVAIPFPSWVHYARASPEYAPAIPNAGPGAALAASKHWAEVWGAAEPPARVTGPPFDAAEVAASKRLLLSMAFKTRMPLRAVLRRHCLQRPGSCGFVEVDTPQVAVERSGRVQNSTAHLQELVRIAQLTRSAYMCAQPPGDQPLRKAMLDCMLLGALPVVFEPFVLDTFAFSDAVDPRTFAIDLSPDIASGRLNLSTTSLVDYLEAVYPPPRRLEMLSRLHTWLPLFQYSLDPVHELVAFDSLSQRHPLDDAFTSSWKAALRSLCARGQLPAARCVGGGGGGGGGGSADSGGGSLGGAAAPTGGHREPVAPRRRLGFGLWGLKL